MAVLATATLPILAAAIFADCFGRGFAAAPSDDALTVFLPDFLTSFFAVFAGPEDDLRMIFDMIGIY